MKVLDLFSGLGGFSKAFRHRGHQVTRVDTERKYLPDITIDIRKFKPEGYYDVVLASPPCIEFTKDFLPWREGNPNTELLEETLRVIREVDPKYHVIENVIGAVKHFKPIIGNYRMRCGSRYLWGNFPRFKVDHNECYGKWEKLRKSTERSKIPYHLSYKLCVTIESQGGLL